MSVLRHFYSIVFVIEYYILPPLQKKKPVDFDGKLKIGNVRYDNITYINNN